MAKRSQRIVLKFGTGILSTEKGIGLSRSQIARLVREVGALVRAGHECVIVSSGAVAAGLDTLGLATKPKELAAKQACAAVGQSQLMHAYASAFAKQGISVAQLLLTHQDLDSRVRHLNARNTLTHLLSRGHVVPIINENDSVAVEELNFGDNDRLSAEVAILLKADLLIILTSVDGLQDAAGKVVPLVRDFTEVASLVRSDKGHTSTGGMVTKLQAAQLAVKAGIPVNIASGRKAGLVYQIVAGKRVGTYFPAK
ncbi:Glutamate 5-kinase [Lacunisphaera limnophila]|uniref:Glutamate 5-kinase n=1 Tax=Lacunisphaera limnophila TaxID=1838286 RepID=A0A1D8AZP3_9BACT|nr:glutamate 5-kinase [Lacunisphaera limnophila]AOS46360.1 Glutamate 5-kinase [Lacunisphaera limnophila]